MDFLNSSVLLPIDMQQGFDQASWPKRWNINVDENGLKLIEVFRRLGRSIVHVQHNSVVDGSSLSPASEGNRFRKGFEPKTHEKLVTKRVNSAFIRTDLDIHLRRIDTKAIVTFGISTDMCVSTTVRMGSNMGWRMILVEDACDCFEQKDSSGAMMSARTIHEAHVATLRAEFCKVVTTAELLKALQA